MPSNPITVITGSSRGIGRAAAELLAARGHRVVISSRDQDSCESVAEGIREAGGEAIAVACHVGQDDQLEALISDTVERFGRLDNLVLNAASNPVYGPSDNVDRKAFDVIMHNNVFGSMRLGHLARPHMAEAGGGAVVLVSSIAGMLGNRVIGAYGLSKAAENQLVRNLALEFGGDGIRVNAVAPGLIRTDFSKALLSDERMVKHFERTTPLGRIGEPEDIARVIAFLVGEDSRWLSGQVVTADGGITVTGGF
ncbi:MAG: glucose 1-dehydrogenase [Wenzhouxiangellaceae bacterium]|jgi:NAD(P)-dependent dehydrogenase (short-subunit alcohol dehydrogenase family)|nr:glucose 1-dehydrogenase [Wenzhouxiangellaceae bacterium]MBS3747155.1 glucose 1-dehydrogenase [Wenzhouxiangellaceae bacterium]MBS3823662.1 glucose 1-dehydrogenase [Wenzhouxiangellaceae bacterium]